MHILGMLHFDEKDTVVLLYCTVPVVLIVSLGSESVSLQPLITDSLHLGWQVNAIN